MPYGKHSRDPFPHDVAWALDLQTLERRPLLLDPQSGWADGDPEYHVTRRSDDYARRGDLNGLRCKRVPDGCLGSRDRRCEHRGGGGLMGADDDRVEWETVRRAGPASGSGTPTNVSATRRSHVSTSILG